jgi:hypothetical protein
MPHSTGPIPGQHNHEISSMVRRDTRCAGKLSQFQSSATFVSSRL